MPHHTLPYHVVIDAFADSPEEAIDNHMSIQTMVLPPIGQRNGTDVLVKICAASVNWVDLLMACGLYQHVPAPPYTPGLEYSGIVEWTGSDVDPTQCKPGDRVLLDGLTAGPRSSGEHRIYGGMASHALAPAASLLPLPEGYTFAEGCNFLGYYETAYHCLVASGQLQAGETVLIHGASGGTGLAAVHIAKRIGATVIATGRNPDKLTIVKEQGADHVIQLHTQEDGSLVRFRDQVKELTDGQGADVVYDGVGGDISLESLRCVTFGARYLIVGWAATPFVAKTKGRRGAPKANMLPTNLIMMKGLKVLGCPTVISTQKHPEIRPARLKQLHQWANEGMRPYLSHQLPFKQYKEALHAKWKSEVIGGCALLVTDD